MDLSLELRINSMRIRLILEPEKHIASHGSIEKVKEVFSKEIDIIKDELDYCKNRDLIKKGQELLDMYEQSEYYLKK